MKKLLFVLFTVCALTSCTKTADLATFGEEKSPAAEVRCYKIIGWLPPTNPGETTSLPWPIYCLKLAPCPDHPGGPIH